MLYDGLIKQVVICISRFEQFANELIYMVIQINPREFDIRKAITKMNI